MSASRKQLRAWSRRANTIYMKAAALFNEMEEAVGEEEEWGLMSFASEAVTSSCQLTTVLEGELKA